MPTAKSSVSIEAPMDDVFEYVSDLRNIAQFVPGITAAEPLGEGKVRVTTEGDTGSRVTEATVRVHEGRRHRVEWEAGGYHGWLEVDREGMVASITAEVHTDHPVADLDAALDQTLLALKACLEPGT